MSGEIILRIKSAVNMLQKANKQIYKLMKDDTLNLYSSLKTLYMTVWAIKHHTSVNNFAYETAEINIEVKHLLHR